MRLGRLVRREGANEVPKLGLHRIDGIADQQFVKPISARRNHPWEGESHSRNGGGVELQHHPRYPQPDDDPHQFPRLNVSAKSDLQPVQHHNDDGQPPEERVSGGENLPTGRRRQSIQSDIEKRFEVPQLFRGKVGRDVGIELDCIGEMDYWPFPP